MPVSHNQAVDLCTDFGFQQRLFGYVEPANYSGIFRFCHKDRILRCRADPPQPFAELCWRSRIAKLTGKVREPQRVSAFRATDSQFLIFPVHRHLLEFAFALAVPLRPDC